MKDGELIGKVHNSVYRQCQKRGYAAPVDVLMDVGVLEKQKYEEWRFGKVPYLEAVQWYLGKQEQHLIKFYAK